jgi:putative OPT family oligopeptide transporter
VLGGDIQWNLIGWGAALGVALIALDEALRKTGKMRLPPLCVGMGIYLPMALTLLIPVGAVLGHFYEKWAEGRKNAEFAKRMGVLAATGLIVGESLFGVAFAGLVAGSGKETPLAVVGGGFEKPGIAIGLVLFTGLTVFLYRAARKACAAA